MIRSCLTKSKMIYCIFISIILLNIYTLYMYKRSVVNSMEIGLENMLGKCEKKTKIMYLKSHKCASSSLQNIFFRFGEKHNLTQVLPNEGHYLGGMFQRSVMDNTPWEKAGMEYSLLCLHVRFNKPQMEAVMGPGTEYITMLRDPVGVFESQYGYYGLSEFYGMSLDEFAAAPKTGKLLSRYDNDRHGRNQMMFDLGLEPKHMDDENMVRNKIEEIENSFDLVMIAEKFSESLVLLKNELCWDVQDVTNFKLNGRKDQVKSNLSDKTRNLLKEFLKSDYMLYDHFYLILQSKLEKFGNSKLATEVSALENANKEISSTCSVKAIDNSMLTGDQKWWGPDLVGHSIKNSTNEECSLMTMPEKVFLNRIRENQRKKANKMLEDRQQRKE